VNARRGVAAPHARRERGSILIEVLVSILICAFGLLGFVALQARATTSEFEAYQRSQALVLLEDITNRLNTNRANAASYVTDGLIGGGEMADCSGLDTSAGDL
jgi:type IV pilus assembly protein PilV